MNKRSKKTRKLLINLVCIIYLTTVFDIKVKASTVDDLKELVGITVEKTDDAEVEVEENEENNTISSQNNLSTFGETVSNETYNSSLVRMEARLEREILDNSSAKLLITTIDNIIHLKNEIAESEKNVYYENIAIGGVPGINERDENEDNQGINIDVAGSTDARGYETDTKIDSANFIIGSIGDLSVTVTGEYKKLETPWGYMLNSDGEIIGDKFLGVDFYIIPGDSVKSQWNGVIYRIENDDITGESNIIINHGRGLFTYYSHIKNTEKLEIGDNIRQGNKIGEGIETTSYEPGKNNHIFYQISIDGNFINPLIVYGEGGKGLYEDWYTSNSDINAVENGEDYFIRDEYDMDDTDKYKVEGVDDLIIDYTDESWKDVEWE